MQNPGVFWLPAGFFLQINWIAQSLISQECGKSKCSGFTACAHRFCTSSWSSVVCRSVGVNVGHNSGMKSLITPVSRYFIRPIQIFE